MKRLIIHFLALALRVAIWLRYRVIVKGKEHLNAETLKNAGGVLFLPNHPAMLIDPVIVSLSIFPQFTIRPMAVEYMYFTPGIHAIMKFLNALPVPNFESSNNSLKRKRHEKVLSEVIKGLKKGENFLLYPAGRLKHTAMERLGGASATHRIVQETPEANIVLVRIKGLWGSSFSRALTGSVPPVFPTLKKGLWILFKNGFFFAPRRKVLIELVPAPKDFPSNASRLELNRWLERWYNTPDELTSQDLRVPGDSLQLVSYSFWKSELPDVYKPAEKEKNTISISNIDRGVQDKVLEKLVDLTELDLDAINPEMTLSNDLGLDSLDLSELAMFIQGHFDTKPIPVTQLTTVERVLAIAAKKITVEGNGEQEYKDLTKWRHEGPTFQVRLFNGDTIPKVFLHACDKMPNKPAYADMRSGILTYSQLKLAVVVLAEKIRHMPGHYIGILLPASVGAFICVLACQLAGKVPLMINWTIGPRHLKAVHSLSNVQIVLTSWAFLERLDRVDLDGLDDKLVMLETLRREMTIADKVKGYFRSKRKPKKILELFGTDKVTGDDPAVLLFTSGTESMPKGVLLTYRNLLSNQKAALKVVKLYSDDVLLAFLPPFHSFGFSLTGLLGLLSGVRTAFTPDPTDGKALIRAWEDWEATLTAGAPTFIKAMLKAAKPQNLRTMRLCVTGAEKTPPDLFDLLDHFNKRHCLVEGYGITECSPILTANIPGQPLRGVGRALSGIELLIVHPETYKILPRGQQGLILACGPNVFSGYLNPGLFSPFITIQGKQWFITGDIGLIDEENFLTISGRKKRFVKVGGEMISLLAIESALLEAAPKKNWPVQAEGATLGLIAKEVPGRKPTLILVATFKTNPDEVNQTLREAGFSSMIRISDVVSVEEIPVMGTGKVNYRLLEETYFV